MDGKLAKCSVHSFSMYYNEACLETLLDSCRDFAIYERIGLKHLALVIPVQAVEMNKTRRFFLYLASIKQLSISEENKHLSAPTIEVIWMKCHAVTLAL